MRQLDLYDEPQLSRRTDKATSHESADSTRVKLGLVQQRCLFMLADGELTASEIAKHCVDVYGGISESYRKRLKELVRAGEVIELTPRECWVTGKSATVYKRITDEPGTGTTPVAVTTTR